MSGTKQYIYIFSFQHQIVRTLRITVSLNHARVMRDRNSEE